MKYYFIFIQGLLLVCLQCNIGYAAEAGMPQLNPEFWPAQIFWLLVSFAFLYLCIWKIILPKIIKNIEDRKSIIMRDLQDAEKFKEKTKDKIEDYKKIIEDAKNEAKKTILEDKNNLEKELNLKKQKFDDEIDGEIKNVEKEIKSFQLTSAEKINDIAKEIVNSLMTKIIGTEVNESNLKAVIESSAKKIDQKQI